MLPLSLSSTLLVPHTKKQKNECPCARQLDLCERPQLAPSHSLDVTALWCVAHHHVKKFFFSFNLRARFCLFCCFCTAPARCPTEKQQTSRVLLEPGLQGMSAGQQQQPPQQRGIRRGVSAPRMYASPDDQ